MEPVAKRNEALYRIITDNKIEFTPYEELHTDLALLHKTSHEYIRRYYESVYFGENVSLTASNFSDCVFSCCTFNSCSISSDAFRDCKFYGCHFYEVKIIPADNQKNCNLIFSNCCGESELRKISCKEPVLSSTNTEIEYEKRFLNNIGAQVVIMLTEEGFSRHYLKVMRNRIMREYQKQSIDFTEKKYCCIKSNCIELNF